MFDATVNNLRIFDNNNWNISVDGIPFLGSTLRELVNELDALFSHVVASAQWVADRFAALNGALGSLGALPEALSGNAPAAGSPPPLGVQSGGDATQALIDAVYGLTDAVYGLVSWIDVPVRGVDSLLSLLQDSYQSVSTFIHALI